MGGRAAIAARGCIVGGVRVVAIGAVALGLTALGASAIGAAESERPAQNAAASTKLTIVDAKVAGQSLEASTRDHPVRMDPRSDVPLSVTIRNDGTTPVEVRYIRITGSLLGLRF